MKIFLRFFVVLIFVSGSVIPQTSQEFKINSDNASSTFIQKNPKLFRNGSKGFLAVWEDYRKGELKYYAQYFDPLGNKINNNFEIYSNYDISFGLQETFIALKEKSYSSSFPPWEYGGFNIVGKKYENFNPGNNEYYFAGGEYPWCGTGWLGYKHYLKAENNNYCFFYNSNGYLSYTIYDENLDLLFSSTDTVSLCSYAGNFSVELNNSEKAVFFLNSYNYEMPVGYYFTLINSNNEITAANIPVKIFDEDEYVEYFYDHSIMEVAALSDSLYLLLWRNSNDEKVSYRKIKTNGEFEDSVNYIDIPFPQGSFNYKSVESILKVENNYNVTQIGFEYNYKLMSESSSKTNYLLITFDDNGNIIKTTVSGPSTLYIANNIFSKNENTFFNVFSDGKDIYMEELTDLIRISDSVKINDDIFGSNESNPLVNFSGDNSIFFAWSDEQYRKGKEISITGSSLGDEKNIKDSDFYFFEDGTRYNIERIINNSDEQEYYLHIFDSNYNLTYTELILKENKETKVSVNTQIVLQDYIYLTVLNKAELLIYKFNKEAGFLKKKVAVENTYSDAVELLKANENSFWFSHQYQLLLFSNDLDTLLQQNIGDFYFDLYRGENTFLSIPSYSIRGKKYGYILSLEGDTLKTEILYDKEVSSILHKISDNKFAFIFYEDNNYYYNVFNYDLEKLSEPVLINNYSQNIKKEISVSSFGNKIVFAWSEARPGGVGYDIYGKILELPKTSAIDDKDNQQISISFKLSQNYPNPFNPSTIINYSLAESGRTKIIVYDILGSEVETLVNQFQQAGNYKVEFNASNLSSGIYFYRIITSNFIETKKMILLR